jgi:hypothetical protein
MALSLPSFSEAERDNQDVPVDLGHAGDGSGGNDGGGR